MGTRTISFINIIIQLVVLTISQQQSNICAEIIQAHRNKQNSQIQQLISNLKNNHNHKCPIYLQPLYQWAQNMTHLHIKFEFINSAHTSACTHILWRKRQVEHNNIDIQLGCIQSEYILIYQIQIKTFMPLNPYHVFWRESEQNSFILQGFKSPSPYFWKRLKLHKKEGQKSNIWWSMLQKYKQNLKQFLGDLQIDDNEVILSKGSKSKSYQSKYHKKHKIKSTYFYCGDNSPFQLANWLTQ